MLYKPVEELEGLDDHDRKLISDMDSCCPLYVDQDAGAVFRQASTIATLQGAVDCDFVH